MYGIRIKRDTDRGIHSGCTSIIIIMASLVGKTAALVESLLSALYAREPHVKVVVATTGGGSAAAELLFRAGSSSTLLEYSIPYARA